MDGAQRSTTEVSPGAEASTAVGALGGVVSGTTPQASTAAERLPAVSKARTEKQWRPAGSSVRAISRARVVTRTSSPRSSSYPATPTSSTEAGHSTVSVRAPGVATARGGVGGVTSGGVTHTVGEEVNRLPAASKARTE